MSNRHNKLNMSHSFTTDFLFCNFNTTPITNYSFITYSLVFSTMALPILYWSKDSLAEQTISFWFICSVVDSLWLKHLSSGTFQYTLRRSKRYCHCIKIAIYQAFFLYCHTANLILLLNLLPHLPKPLLSLYHCQKLLPKQDL